MLKPLKNNRLVQLTAIFLCQLLKKRWYYVLHSTKYCLMFVLSMIIVVKNGA